MRKEGKKFNWLAKQVGLSNSYLHLVLKGKGRRKAPLTEENKRKIAAVLKIEL